MSIKKSPIGLDDAKVFLKKINFEKLKRPFLFVVLFFVVYYFVVYFMAAPKLPSDVKNELSRLDSLTRVLEKEQFHYDSLIIAQKRIIEELDFKLENIREKTVIVKEYYHEQQQIAQSYNYSQIDSFFTERYKSEN